MEDKKIQILQELIHVFEQKDFDFKAWKIKAKLVLSNIFGSDDVKINLIEDLHYDFSSWSLRDNSGGKQHDTIKDQAKQIIESAIIELKLSESDSVVSELIRKHLTGKEYDEFQLLLGNSIIKEEDLLEYFSKIATSKKDLILAQIVLKLE